MPSPSGKMSSLLSTVLGRVRRRPVVTTIVLLLLVVRIALPSIIRHQLEKQATAALTARLTVGDVRLSLLRGSVALEDVALRADGAPPTDEPLVAFHRVYVRLGYFGLLRHTLRIQEFALDGPVVAVVRTVAGDVPLPGPRAPAAAKPEAAAKEAKPAGTPWNIVVDEAALHDGRLRVRDHASDPPAVAELALDTLGLRNFALIRTGHGEPGHATIEAKFGDGVIRIDNSIATRADGFTIKTIVDVSNLPLDRTQLHAPQLRWRSLAGRMDAHVVLRTEPRLLPVSSGSVAFRDLRIEVPDEEAPALAWRKLAVDIGGLDLAKHQAIVKSVKLDGGSVLVTPKAPAPLPLLAGILKKPAPAAPAPAPASTPAAPEPASVPWTWKVDTVEVTDTTASVTLTPPAIPIQIVKATITNLDGKPGTETSLDVQLRQHDGTIGLSGTVALEPLATKLQVRIAGLALGPLVAASAAVPARLPSGTLDTDLAIEVAKGTLAVRGKLGVADLSVRPAAGEDFALDWKRLDVAIAELRVPGAVPGPAPPDSEPVRANFDEIRLVAPTVALTRDPSGLVLPGSTPAAASQAAPPPASETAPARPPGRPLALSLGRLALEKGTVSILDRTVKPFYRGTVSAIALQASGLRFPDNTFEAFTFAAMLPGGAPLKLAGKQANGMAQITVDGKRLPLKQFNPYVTQAAGYSIADGSLNVGSTVRYGRGAYDSKTRLELDRLGVAGAGGDSLFLQKIGIPLELAISLLRDLHGRIALDIPVGGDKSGTHVGLASIVSEALVKAIIGAVASPLKMFGAVVDLAGGHGAGAAPEPIPCRPGAVAPEDPKRVEQVADGLAGAPGLKVSLQGTAGGPDVRGLQERAVLADLQAKQGVFGGIKTLANRGERNAIRDALAARTEGHSADLSPEYQKTLDEWAGQKQISDDDLRALAKARADGLRDTLVKDQGVDAGRISTGDPEVKRDGGTPGVRVGLGF